MVGAKIESENIVDKSILGGFIAKFDDQMLDMSLNGKLNKLKESILDY
jgi:F0F1-type ATP synthase delta subunit